MKLWSGQEARALGRVPPFDRCVLRNQRADGCWLVYYSDGSSLWVKATELEPLETAGMKAADPGEALREAVVEKAIKYRESRGRLPSDYTPVVRVFFEAVDDLLAARKPPDPVARLEMVIGQIYDQWQRLGAQDIGTREALGSALANLRNLLAVLRETPR